MRIGNVIRVGVTAGVAAWALKTVNNNIKSTTKRQKK